MFRELQWLIPPFQKCLLITLIDHLFLQFTGLKSVRQNPSLQIWTCRWSIVLVGSWVWMSQLSREISRDPLFEVIRLLWKSLPWNDSKPTSKNHARISKLQGAGGKLWLRVVCKEIGARNDQDVSCNVILECMNSWRFMANLGISSRGWLFHGAAAPGVNAARTLWWGRDMTRHVPGDHDATCEWWQAGQSGVQNLMPFLMSLRKLFRC